MRICAKCELRAAMNTRGMARCDECRHVKQPVGDRMCANCGQRSAANTLGVPRCGECGEKRRLQVKSCPSCGREHASKAGNAVCGSCKHQAAKHPCATCGDPCDKRATVCLSCLPHPSGEDNPNYKGGVVMASRLRGYVRVRAPEGHPRAKNGGRYIQQHTHVMEQAIGRFLLPGESVHHRNGVRHDNRLENLELWAVSQPAGQRAVDLLAWAREITDRYEPLVPLLIEGATQ